MKIAQRASVNMLLALPLLLMLFSLPVQANGTAVAFFSGPRAPVGIAVKNGTVYWANYDSGELLAMKRGAASPTVLLNGLTHPSGVAVDRFGNLFFSEDTVSFSDVKELVGAAGTPKSIFSVGQSVSFITVDRRDNVYFEQGGGCNGQGYNNSIMEYVNSTGRIRTVLPGFLVNNPSYGQVFVRSGGLYFTTCTGDLDVLRPIHGGSITVLVSGLGSGPSVSSNGVAVDRHGSVFFTDYWNSVGELLAGSTTPVTISTAGGTHYCLAVARDGTVFYTDNLGGIIWEVPSK